MLNLISCELSKLKHSKMVLISILGVMSTPFLMLVEALQTHFQHPERVFTLANIYDNSLPYMMLLTNMMIYVVITAYLFSREYTENTFKTILPIPISRTKLLLGKFCTLFLWIVMLTFVTWVGIFTLLGIYHAVFVMEEYNLFIAIEWLFKFLLGNMLMFLTFSPFTYIAHKTKGFVAPVIACAVSIMGSVALSNQKFGAFYPWTATFFLVKGKMQSTGYSIPLAIIAFVSLGGFLLTFNYFKKEDLK
ncbi:bacitracin ABC transporter permease [Clostridium niameyense]|uniref:Bacitracin ABC transporter permease n=1 Tax=Clostridium niameyense TaxID=1622073 RepID=A0A6M0R9Y7_9CLOT|nr:ABC transporter permease [Clostridium niameyense]NEZ46419.1 bacitracin ABC transporter permease [Clostridium niameyense]